MPLVNIREVYPGVRLGLWEMTESENDFYALSPAMSRYRSVVASKYKSEQRRKEFLAVRALLHEMLDDKVGEITHNDKGKPALKGWHISVSHTRGYAALILSRKQEVGVDIEYFSDRVDRIASKFLRKDEHASDTLSRLVHWCGKETIYKLFSDDNLQYKEMRVSPFDVNSDWYCVIENLRHARKVNVDFELTMEFVLTYCSL